MSKPDGFVKSQKPTGASVPVSAEDLERFIQTQDDFGLELFVYSNARDLGFYATHGGTYVDRVSNLTRQYDIRASIVIDDTACVEIPIECKCLKDTGPILLSRIPRIAAESYHEKIEHNHFLDGGYKPHHERNVDVVRQEGVASLYVPNSYVAKSIAQIKLNDRGEFSSRDSEVFAKWSQALASSYDLIKGTVEVSRESWKYNALFTIVIPVLVVSDGTLWVADYSENGTLQGAPYQVDEATMFVGETYIVAERFQYKISHLHIFTKSGVVRFLGDLVNNHEFRSRFKI